MNPPPRLFVKPDLVPGHSVAISAEQAHYLARVLRLGAEDPVRMFNGRDGEWLARYRPPHTLHPARLLREQRGPIRETELWWPPLRTSRMAFLVEKATELGVTVLRPAITARSRGGNTIRCDRLLRIAVEASEQTERLDLPAVEPARPLRELLAAQRPLLVWCDESGTETEGAWRDPGGVAHPIAEVAARHARSRVAILVGPEGGFTAEERELLRGSPGTLAVALGPNILRTETAALAALAVWQLCLPGCADT